MLNFQEYKDCLLKNFTSGSLKFEPSIANPEGLTPPEFKDEDWKKFYDDYAYINAPKITEQVKELFVLDELNSEQMFKINI